MIKYMFCTGCAKMLKEEEVIDWCEIHTGTNCSVYHCKECMEKKLEAQNLNTQEIIE